MSLTKGEPHLSGSDGDRPVLANGEMLDALLKHADAARGCEARRQAASLPTLRPAYARLSWRTLVAKLPTC